MDAIDKIQQRIRQLEKRRAAEIKRCKLLCSCPEQIHTHRLGFGVFQQHINKKYAHMIDAERQRIEDLKPSRGKSAVSPECPSAKRADDSRRNQPHRKRPRTTITALESSDGESRSSNKSEDATEANLNTTGWSSTSASQESSEDSEDSDDEPITKPCGRRRRVIDSDSDSSGNEDPELPPNRTSLQVEEVIAIDSDSDGEVEQIVRSGDEDFELTSSEHRHEHHGALGDHPVFGSVFKPVQRQGFKYQVSLTDDGEACRSEKTPEKDCAPSFDPDEVDFRGRTFQKTRCYAYQDMLVGIEFFVSLEVARCVMLLPFDETIIGVEDEEVDYKADSSLQGSYVRLNRVEDIPLDHIGSESTRIQKTPELTYQPQEEEDWRTFAYYYDSSKMKRKGIRRRKIRSLELFAGAGGSLLGYEICGGFETCVAVENDPDACDTLRSNHPHIKVYQGCIKQFVQNYAFLKSEIGIGEVDHLHFSSPCQEFSNANRFKGSNTDRADLSLLLIDLVRLTGCQTAVFENVEGIWTRMSIQYMKNICKDLIELGYQMKVTTLQSQDYGDPQKRPRFFMFISKRDVPLPPLPNKTHGTSANLLPFVTSKDALSGLSSSLPNFAGKVTQCRPGQHGITRLAPYLPAPTVRASTGVTAHHYEESRPINVREAASLQSFPKDYKFCGSTQSQYKQVGNAVPIELATSVAGAIRHTLRYEYCDGSNLSEGEKRYPSDAEMLEEIEL